MIAPDPFLAMVEKFISDTGMYPTDFGNWALGDGNFVFQLREGRDVRRSTQRRVEAQIQHYRTKRRFMDLQTLRDTVS